jgi:hypothetical protein
MSKKQLGEITTEWLEIKGYYETKTFDPELLDEKCHHFIWRLSELTERNGFECVVEGVKMDLWKERIWCLVENAGLLPEIAWKEELEAEKELADDDWYLND